MRNIYVLYEERESSQLCGIRGVWNTLEEAQKQMHAAIQQNSLYSEYSSIDLQTGKARSDPTYSEEIYSDYSIECFEIS